MGNVVPTGRAVGNARELLGQIDDEGRYVFQETLWEGKFLKSVRCQSNGNVVVCKIYEKIPEATDPKAMELLKRELTQMRTMIQPHLHPNLIPYNRWGETNESCFLIRQYIASSLYDRLNTRPFLSVMEKRWIAFQLLKALSQCHNAGLVHGDIKAENVLVTSWNWVLLGDFAPYKPTFLPLDDTAPYHYFFASANRRDACCVAPERFCSPTSTIDISLLDSAPPQCSSFLSVMMDTEAPVVDADHALAESANSLFMEEEDHQAQAAGEEGDDTSNNNNFKASSPGGSGKKQRSYSFSSNTRSQRLRPSMDIFSLGCVIMELFQDGEPCFNLSELLKYAKRGEENKTYLGNKLQKVKQNAQSKIGPLVLQMLDDDPTKRLSADSYIAQHSGPEMLFPPYFNDFLHPFMAKILSSDFDIPDERIWVICKHYGKILKNLCDQEDKLGQKYFQVRYEEWAQYRKTTTNKTRNVVNNMMLNNIDSDIIAAVEEDDEHNEQQELQEMARILSDQQDKKDGVKDSKHSGGETPSSVQQLLMETEKILSSMAKLKQPSNVMDTIKNAQGNLALQYSKLTASSMKTATDKDLSAAKHGRKIENIFGMDFNEDVLPGSDTSNRQENGSVLVLSIVCTTMRFVRSPTTKVIALRLLSRFCVYSDDETRLQRVLPYVVALLNDSASIVRRTAVRVLTNLLQMIHSLPSSDRRIFPEYLFPALGRFKTDVSLNARLAFAECLPRIAEASVRFLELAHQEKKGNYDAELDELHTIMQEFVSNMIEQPAVVRRTLLCDITRLCLFFGRERTSGHILPILITFLNERNDWQVRATFFEHIPGVCALVGPIALQQFLLPCILQALQDVEELVIERTLCCLYTLSQLGLLDTTMMAELTNKVVPLIYHPSTWIRNAVVRLLAALVSSKHLGPVEIQVTIVRLLLPCFKASAMQYAVLLGQTHQVEENERLLHRMIQTALPRDIYKASLASYEKELASTAANTPDSASSSAPTQPPKAQEEKTSSSNTWLKLSHRPPPSTTKSKPTTTQEQEKEEREKEKEKKVEEELTEESTATTTTVSDGDRLKLRAMEPYMKSSVGARRGDRSKPSDAPTDLPSEYTTNLAKRSQLYSVVVPDQSHITLAIRRKYSEFIDLKAPSMAPGSFLLHQHPAFKATVDKYGILSRSRRHGGGMHPMTSEALSAGANRLAHRIEALGVPPLPPDMGSLRKLDGSYYIASVRRLTKSLGSLSVGGGGDSVSGSTPPTTKDAAATPTEKPWRPRGVLAANLYGHDGAVNRIAVSQDSLFFATGSNDGTVRLWLTAELEDGFGIQPKLTYASQGGCVTDLCIIENTHSVASASTTGSVHVFKVEHALDATRAYVDPNETHTSKISSVSLDNVRGEELDRENDGANANDLMQQRRQQSLQQQQMLQQQRNLASSTVMEVAAPEHGAIRAICHFPTVTESLLTFASESGTIHGWDLRCRARSWGLNIGPQAGFITNFAVPPEGDALWMVAGTSRGLILLFDIRFQILLKAWRHPSHSKIHQLYISRATCSDPYVYIAAGGNQFTLYNISNGQIVHGFKSISTDVTAGQACEMQPLESIPIDQVSALTGPSRKVNTGIWQNLALEELESSKNRSEPSVRTILCPFDAMDIKEHTAHIPPAVISAGTDRRIRYWHTDVSLCYSIFDQEFGITAKQYWDKLDNVTVCREDLVQHKTPQPSTEGRGLPHPSSNHDDAILDMAFVNSHSAFQNGISHKNPGFLLTASRDGVVKAWV